MTTSTSSAPSQAGAPSATPRATPNAAAFRVLAIEDDLSIARLLQANIIKAGMQFRHAAAGAVGLKALEEFQPHLVLLDLMLPDISGYEVCARIRQSSHIPVIMITARNQAEDHLQGLKCGADDYVTKPFDLALLMARVATHLRRAHRYNASLSAPTDSSTPVASARDAVPFGWSKCPQCSYMGPHGKFEELDERFQLKRACPHCLLPVPNV